MTQSQMTGNDDPQVRIDGQQLALLWQLSVRARGAASETTLGFTIVNETLALVPYRQAAWWRGDTPGHVAAVSGLPQSDPNAPYVQWLGALCKTLAKGPGNAPPKDAASCAPGGDPVQFSGSIGTSDVKHYRMLPFKVAPGTGRVEMTYGWTDKPGLPSTPLTATTLDLGLWDQHGYRNNAGFRGWSGSRQGRIDQQQNAIFVQADSAERGYRPGKIEPGVWYADLGVGASSPQGADWVVNVTCKAGGGVTPADDPVDRTHVARAVAGWYAGDMHMHAYHSNPNAPDWDGFIAQARAARLDFLMVTEYVTTQHWRTLGAVPNYFDVTQFDVTVEQRYNAVGEQVTVAMAVVKVKVGEESTISAAEGNGPVNALDQALRKDLGKYQKYIEGLSLTDFRVRILNSGTEAVTRVLIESEDENGDRWTTVGVSPNIIDASFQALMDSIVFKLVKSGAPV